MTSRVWVESPDSNRSRTRGTPSNKPLKLTADRFVQREPWLERDKAMIDQLKSIGIEKGKPFNPDPKTQDILRDAAREAHAWIDDQYGGAFFSTPYYEGTHWALPGSPAVLDGLRTQFANRPPEEGGSQVLEANSSVVTQCCACVGYSFEELGVVFDSVVHPGFFVLETDQHPGRAPVARNHDLSLTRESEISREVILHLR